MGPPRFVLLEHYWRGVHWDLMLESGDSLRTWALDEPPAPGLEIVAGALPDHRLAYLDFEGAVSGDRGTVRRLDRGTYAATLWTDDRVVVALSGDHLDGEIELLRVVEDDRADPRRGWRLRMTSKVRR